MIATTYPVLAPFTGSAQSLSRSLSPFDRIPPESSRDTRRRQSFSPWKSLIHLPTGQLSRSILHRKPQKVIQYPATRSRSVQ
jgi:hypothetical protein